MSEQNHPDPSLNVPSAERVLMILRIIAGYGRPVSASELIVSSGLNKSTVYRLLAALRRWGFVMETGALYAPGPASLQMALNFDSVALLSQHASAAMHWLRENTQETVAITVAMQQEAVCISMLEPRQSLRCSFEKGRSLPLHRGATAKCLLAHLPVSVSQIILKTHYKTLSERADRQQELTAIFRQGYSCSESEVDEGVWGVSVPVFSPDRQLLGALSLMAPVFRAENNIQGLIEFTLNAAKKIHRSLDETFNQSTAISSS
nr:IclR family transcriptional regulator [Tatumella morbirosei]